MIEFKSSSDKQWVSVEQNGENVGEFHQQDLQETLPALHAQAVGQCKVYTHNLHHELSEVVEQLSGLSSFKFMKEARKGFVII